jgi:DNA-directed RNA polymerase specialized sigma24 family protein
MDADTEDIAGIMSLSRQSVQNLLHDALRRLRKVRKVIVTNVLRRL